MATSLVSLETARHHLNDWEDTHGVDIENKSVQATELVLNYLKERGTPTWTETTVPEDVQACILIVLADLFRFRGDDSDRDEGKAMERVRMLLEPRRVPTLA